MQRVLLCRPPWSGRPQEQDPPCINFTRVPEAAVSLVVDAISVEPSLVWTIADTRRQCCVSSCGVRRGERVAADYAFQSVESAARFFRTYFFCCASASRTLSANDFSAFATIALNASVSMHVTQSGLTGSAGFNGRPRFCR